MFGKWRKEKKTKETVPTRQSSAESSKASEKSSDKKGAGVTIRVDIPFPKVPKKCPACNTEYTNENLVVCPKDRTMLLRPVSPSDWYEWHETAAYCLECKAIYYEHRFPNCPRDNALLTPLDSNPFNAPVLQDRYQLVRFVERGRFFDEYEALDHQSSQPVRVKLMQRQLSQDARTVANFFKHVRPAIGLKHDNVISVSDVNATDEGIPYLIADHIKTTTLSDELEERELFTPKETKKIFTDFLSAIQHAHDQGIVHGGISTHNLLLARDADPPIGYVANFGVAERLFREMDWTQPSTNTHTANVYGDPSTICPEFCTGQRPTPASDIYQLGCCLYECLSGKIPFERETMPRILLAHMTDEPDDIRAKNPEISPELAAIVYRCLKKEPAERYPCAQALSEAIASEVEG